MGVTPAAGGAGTGGGVRVEAECAVSDKGYRPGFCWDRNQLSTGGWRLGKPLPTGHNGEGTR